MRTIRYARLAIGACFFLLMTLTFVGLQTLDLPAWQFFPALLGAHVAIVAVLVGLTLVIGRVYCSTLCPLGIVQDIAWWVAKKTTKRAKRFSYAPEHVSLRYAVLLVVLVSMAAGGAAVLNFIEPYSMFGRIVAALVYPLWQWSLQHLAVVGATQGWFLLVPPDLVWHGAIALAVGALSFLVIVGLSFRYGRLYCQTICPVGTMLGTVSRFSLYGPTFHTEACIRCKKCERACASRCIDVAHQRVDTSRCVDCLACLTACPTGAMQFGRRIGAISTAAVPEELAMSRRDMLIRSGVAVSAACIALAKDSLPVEAAMDDAATIGPIMPPGATSFANFTQRCTACHRCVTACPSGVLQPATLEYKGAGLWQPRLAYTQGYCVLNCTTCSHVCPTGAIRPISLPQKKVLQIGKAVYYPVHCLINEEGYACGICVRHCPVQAIDMVPQSDGKILPKVKHSKCIGCGSCEYHCPTKAISVKTMRVQKPLGSGRGKHAPS